MRIQTSVVVGVVILVTSVALVFFARTVKVQDKISFVQQEIPVVVKPLLSGTETVPVEIQCDPVFATAADTIERFNCVLINHTSKNIRASSVRYTVLSENGGKEQRSDHLDTADTYIHPDLAEAKKPVGPAGQIHVMAPGPLVESDRVIKSMEIEPIYIEFSDGTSVGTGGLATKMIADVRDGAAKFKEYLRKEFESKGKSAEAILPILEDAESAASRNFTNGALIGANAYRRFLLEKYKKGGNESVRTLLEN